MRKEKQNSSCELKETAVAEALQKTVGGAKTPINAEEEQRKMTIFEYEDKYVHRQNTRGAAFLVKLAVAVLGVFLFTCFFTMTMKAWEANMYFGIGMAAVSVLMLIFLYIVPIVKILKSEYFITNVNLQTAKEAKKHNKELRSKIADKMIDLTASVEGVGWYDEQIVGELAIARKAGNDNKVKENLTKLYKGSVKKSANDIIVKCSVKSGLYSAISQTGKIDAALIAVVNLQMIKDLVFLYGFRPSDARLLKIFGKVLQNSLIAYGLGSVKIGNGVVKTMGDMARSIPILGSAISVLVDSSVQGLANGTLTAVIGYQTIKYLSDEYKLQDILDGIEIEEEKELTEVCTEVERQLKTATTTTLKAAKKKSA